MDKKVPTKLYYTIGEVSKMLDLSTSKIRHWEGEIQSLNPKKQSNGNRAFTQKDIENIKLIKHLVESGYTLEGVNRKLQQSRKEILANVEMIDRLQKIRAFLVSLKS